MKKFLLTLATAGLLMLGSARLSAQTSPATIVHVVTVTWKPGTTPAQIQAALDGVKALPAQYGGIVHVWIKSIKVQGGKANAFVMEFADAAAFQAYTNSPAQKEWYKSYLPIRGESTTFDITN
jgi:hypothetical protein